MLARGRRMCTCTYRVLTVNPGASLKCSSSIVIRFWELKKYFRTRFSLQKFIGIGTELEAMYNYKMMSNER